MSGEVGKRPAAPPRPYSNAEAVPGRGWPGKRALTDSMSAPPRATTGIPVVDNGLPCDDAEERAPDEVPDAHCYLSPRQRERLLESLGNRVGQAHGHFVTAVNGKRIEVLAARDSGWGFCAEMLFNLASFTAVGAVAAALARVRRGAVQSLSELEFRAALGATQATERGAQDAASRMSEFAASLNVETVAGALGQTGKAVRSGIKERAKTIPRGTAGRAAFLLAVADGAGVLAQSIREDLPTTLDDGGLLLLVESYDAASHSLGAYARAVDDLISRYAAQEIEHVGQSWEHDRDALYPSSYARDGRLDPVRITYRGRERVALVENGRTRYRASEPEPGEKRPIDASSIAAATWVRWVDDDLAGAAQGAYEARVGPVMSVDVEAGEIPPTWAPMVAAWVATVPAKGAL